MFSALKKLAAGNNKNEANGKTPAGGQQAMHASLQKKFAKGVHYNMKIIIRGDRNVGKSCLFHRLQGKAFIDNYDPTQEIQVASIQWSYKATDDIVKVEVWDVVDKGKKKKPLEGLKLNTLTPASLAEEPALDAEFLDVYKGTHGVIIMLDITKQWTFDYVKRELPKIPTTIPVMVLANHRDMGHHRCVSEDDVKFFIESLNRSKTDAQIRFGESSMRNSFGLKLLHKFFNLPFLALQRDSLLKQLETNLQEMSLTNEELDLYLETDDASYDKFLDLLTQKRRQTADSLSAATASNAVQAPAPNAPISSAPAAKPQAAVNPVQATTSKIMKSSIDQPKHATQTVNTGDSTKKENEFSSVEDFIVDGDDGEQALGFLSSVDEIPSSMVKGVLVEQDSDSDAENEGNPMVMGFQDEIDDEDYLRASEFGNPVTQISDSSSDEEVPVPQADKKEAAAYKVNKTVEDITIEDDLDDWLNDGAEKLPSSKLKVSSSSSSLKNNESVNRKVPEPKTVDVSLEELSLEVTGKSKRVKEKKSKRKSKKSSKDERTSSSPAPDSDVVEESRPYNEYEEL
ncbi:rab-like protein 6 isoform X1 [Daphnia pulicaria]|uniref:rab-like protein 6 isoform X1 n=1 Tax=Daphnia pulicaria TaxID=35523 RepID=UPI001EEA7201|nr:rab-like protein 6 isoform X1 [Daphnia pulicaria]